MPEDKLFVPHMKMRLPLPTVLVRRVADDVTCLINTSDYEADPGAYKRVREGLSEEPKTAPVPEVVLSGHSLEEMAMMDVKDLCALPECSDIRDPEAFTDKGELIEAIIAVRANCIEG